MAITPVPRSRGITLFSMGVFFALLLALTWFLVWSEATKKIDNLLHDNWVRFSQTDPPEQVAIAAIDSTSLQSLGRWPWPRDLQALLLQRLGTYGVKAVVIDILFNEKSANSNDDQALIDALSNLNTVVVPVLTEGRHVAREVTRRVFLKGGSPTPHWSHLALEAYKQIEYPEGDFDDSKLPGKKAWHDNRADTRYALGNRSAQSKPLASWKQDYEVLIPFYGPRGTIPYVSAEDIINGSAPKEALADKVVFLGMTSTGLGDDQPTPVSALDRPVPGVELHANIYSALIDNRLKTIINPLLNFLVALLLFPLMLLVYSRARPQWGLLIAAIGSLLPILLSFLLYRYTHNWFAPMAASIPLFVSYILWSSLIWQSFSAQRNGTCRYRHGVSVQKGRVSLVLKLSVSHTKHWHWIAGSTLMVFIRNAIPRLAGYRFQWPSKMKKWHLMLRDTLMH